MDETAQGQVERTALKGVYTCGFGLLLNVVSVVTANSLVLVADFFKSSLEFTSITLTWLTLRVLRRDDRAVFNYGLGKIENLASLLIGIFMLLGVLIMAALIGHRVLNPVRLQGAGIWLGVVCTLVFGSLNGWLWAVSLRQRRRERSPILEAQCRLFAVKTVANGLMFLNFTLSLGLQQSWAMYLDPLASGLTVGFMIQNTWHLIRHSIRELLDRSLEEPLQMVINRQLVKHFNEYRSLDGVRSRYSGRRVFIEMFLGFDPARTLGEVEQVTTAIKTELERDIPGSEVVVVPRAQSGQP